MNPDVARRVKAEEFVKGRMKERVIRMMTKACEALFEAGPGETWVKEMAPLTLGERDVVREIVAKRFTTDQ